MELDYSAVNSLMQCPAKYAYEHKLGLKGPSNSDLYLGSTFHKAAQRFYELRQAGITPSLNEYQELFIAAYESGEAAIDRQGVKREVVWRDSYENLLQLGLAMCAAYYPLAKQQNPLFIEYKLEKELSPNLKVFGTIDLTLDNGDLVDIKTSGRALWQSDLDASLQPTFYALLIGGPTQFHYHDVIKGKAPTCQRYTTHRSQRDIDWLCNALPMFAMLAEKGPWMPHRTNLCKYCAYEDMCLKGDGLGKLAEYYLFGEVANA